LCLELDRLDTSGVSHEIAVALLLMVARDLEDKLIAIGFGENQEMGLVCVEKVRMMFDGVKITGSDNESAAENGEIPKEIEFNNFNDFCANNDNLLKILNTAWKKWVEDTRKTTKEQGDD
jgi:hypothetical protein